MEKQKDNAWISGNDFWIMGLRMASWVVFAVILYVGIVAGVGMVQNDQMGFGIGVILLSAVVSFLSVAATMVFLNLAQDIAILREIRQREYFE